MRKKVLVLGPIHDAGVELLRGRPDVATEIVGLDEPRLAQVAKDAHGIIARTTRIDRALVAAAQVLEIVSRHGVGTDSVDIDALTERGIPLTITPGSNSPSVAEHTMFMLLALARRCRSNDTETRDGGFVAARAAVRPIDVQDRTMLIIGFGRIGSLVAPLARAFGMTVLAYDPYIDQTIITDAGCTPLTDFREALGQIDVLTVHCPLTPETRHIIGQAELEALKPDGFVINTARGGIVDESALAQALRSGALAGAGLDVFECEPAAPQPDHPLFRFDNVITSPHCAGVSQEASLRTSEHAVRNVLDCFDGKLDPGAVVNPEVLG